ncbi:unnamed protein product [Tuber melanosporum]|uniref:(Perigord truffle) hypothetical protein n=1 Tax=Tuber melanosporum (strain Mel28) TaxID=656061 RepID=D5GLZ8_TUBMM|nr:uncharacterized protein GSTUM_00010337001 [Tuber melanosporum]CAZ85460.1 unnamed protein product [Tuber melanosporum]
MKRQTLSCYHVSLLSRNLSKDNLQHQATPAPTSLLPTSQISSGPKTEHASPRANQEIKPLLLNPLLPFYLSPLKTLGTSS